jgi:hypothetical protein
MMRCRAPQVSLEIDCPEWWGDRARAGLEREAERLRDEVRKQLASGMTPEDINALFGEFATLDAVLFANGHCDVTLHVSTEIGEHGDHA